jgi:uncharacterized repeat protein (TIGR01451 family)
MVRIARFGLMVMAAVLACAQLGPAAASQRSPGWWDPDGVETGADWHYRVPVALPAASAFNSTAKVDIDFAALMTQLGISGTFDANSVRVVRPGGAIATVQEYNDTIYGGATDASATRGEVRWIAEDGGAQTYYVYFDVTANGTKSANPQTPINGNFEHSASGTQLPSGWANATKSNAVYDMQVRPSESLSVTSNGSPANNPFTTDGTPKTGGFSYLLGARSNNEPTTGAGQLRTTVLTKSIAVPSSNAGSLVINWRPEGWDASSFDQLFVTITSSTGTVTEYVGATAGNYATAPYSPSDGNSAAGLLNRGYGHYNGFDYTTLSAHTLGMSVGYHAEPWWSKSIALSGYAGQTVTLTIGTNNSELDRSWFHVDDIEWSVVNGTVGAAEGFGVAAASPAGSSAPGQVLTLTAVVDAKPTAAASPVTADVVNNAGTTVASGVKLFNDGTHGDAAANDATWTNNGSDGANPTYTIPIASGSSAGWKVRVYAKDASTSTQGQAGMVHRTGQGTALVLANWWTIDEQTFTVDAANIGVTKSMTLISDGVNATNFKVIPGAQLRFCVTISNSGTATASSVVAADTLPAPLAYVPGSMLSGADCASAATAEDDNAAGADETDPVGASYSGTTLSITRASLATSGSFAVTYRVTVS